MVRLFFLSFWIFSLSLLGCGVTSPAGAESIDLQMIRDGNFIYTVQSVSPSGGRTIRPTTIYTMEASGGTFKANLPYFGRAYQATYGGSGGVEFEGEPSELKVEENEQKGTVRLSFSIQAENPSSERYEVNLEVGPTGYGSLIVRSNNRQTISYYGVATPR